MAAQAPEEAQIALSLPTIHCAGLHQQDRKGAQRPSRRHLGTGQPDPQTGQHRCRAGVVTAEEMRALVERLGYEAYELDPGTLSSTATDRAGRTLLMRLAVAGFATMNVMLLSVSVWSGAEGPTRDLFHWISAAIALPAIAFFRATFFCQCLGRAAQTGSSTWMCRSRWPSRWRWSPRSGKHHCRGETCLFRRGAGADLFSCWRGVTSITAPARRRVLRPRSWTALEVPRATRLNADGSEEAVPVAVLAAGDLLRVRPGGRMAGRRRDHRGHVRNRPLASDG